MKQDGLLTMLSSVNNDIQFSMKLSDNKLPFLEIRLTNPGQKIWMNIYSKPKDSKRYVSYLSNYPKTCLVNISFCLARRICMIVENENIRSMKLKELWAILKTQQYQEMVVEMILVIPQEQLRSEKLKNNDDFLPFISTYILTIQMCFWK